MALLIVCTLAACSSNKSKSEPTTVPPSTAAPTTTIGSAVKGDAFCTAALAAIRDEQSINLANGASPAVKIAAAKTVVDVLAAQKVAPDDFSAEWSKIVAGLQKFKQVLADNNYDVAAFKASSAGAALLNDSQLAQTFTDIDKYLADNCGVTP
jgi:hypothetical protein